MPKTDSSARRASVVQLTEIAICTALLAVSAQITVPMPGGVPVTLQTLAVALCGYLLGTKKGLAAMGAYLVLGALGVPVFAGFGGGIGILLGKTGGFIIGFFFLALFCGISADLSRKGLPFLFGLLGLVLCHLLGLIWFCVLTAMPVGTAALLVSVPFLLKDVLSVFGALVIGRRLRKLRRF